VLVRENLERTDLEHIPTGFGSDRHLHRILQPGPVGRVIEP
jgi:hypothetical protein